ncbi:helix-turn-helix transcriptional regulator [Gordonia rhizosphera]|uniref:Putative AraC family transcriptional regulator n=1 Tax=Gordonia rhizosphera NBRC 16068 TaxID=1108045 RepID=K6WVY4_9ACTN|nr:AraC family transcriptional regulator [Gordonia rhizosphera]GAB90709.1 putative AraC family transcriptional regulator [Gordonia rhizosphera NBRC 16068]
MTESAPMVDPECTARSNGAVALSTRDLTSAEGRALWAETLDSTYCEMAVDWPATQSSFGADIIARPVGDLSLSMVRADPHAVVRTAAMIESDPGDDYLLCLITKGSATISQGTHEAVLCDGAFGFVDSSRPFIVNGVTPFEQIVLRTPRALVSSRIGQTVLQDAVGQSISGGSGVGRVASNLLVDLATHDDFCAGSLFAVSSAVLDVVSAAVNHQVDAISLTDRAHADDLRTVQQVMLRDIGEPDRRIADVGAELGMSVRYIHKLFSAAGTTPRAWLYARRFDRARNLLLHSDLGVVEIGVQLGFRDASHFSRAFSRHCGSSPSRFRVENRPGGSPVRGQRSAAAEQA